jgi:hypothetical protein
MFQQIPQLLLLIAVTGMALSVVAFVLSIFAPRASTELVKFTEKLVIPVHVLLATAVLAEVTKPGSLCRFGAWVDRLPLPWFLTW